jgi:hypothetical protein
MAIVDAQLEDSKACTCGMMPLLRRYYERRSGAGATASRGGMVQVCLATLQVFHSSHAAASFISRHSLLHLMPHPFPT